MTLPRPQRIGHDSPPGSLLKRIGEATPAPRKTETDTDPAYLALVRQCPCLYCGMEPSEAALPADEEKRKQRMVEAAARFRAEMAAEDDEPKT